MGKSYKCYKCGGEVVVSTEPYFSKNKTDIFIEQNDDMAITNLSSDYFIIYRCKSCRATYNADIENHPYIITKILLGEYPEGYTQA